MSIEMEIEGYSDGDVDTNRSSNGTLQSMIDKRYSRRQTLFGGMSATAMAFLGTSMLSACGGEDGTANTGPTVSAGGNATTSSGRAVTLAGTASDSDGIGGVTWTQVSGPQVTLTGANTANASFIAPSVATATELKFRHSATDTSGALSAAETTVTVEPATLGFTAVSKNLNDIVTVPAGYTVSVLYRTGDPIAAGVPAYANDGTDVGFDKRAGDQHDGMTYFGLSAAGTPDENSSTRGVLAINHENILHAYLHPNGKTAGTRLYSEVIKEIEAHGVSIVETRRAADGTWSYVQDSSLNRRITPLTPMTIHGPARGNALMKTVYSTNGTQTRGTINNCANGYTPWHTYLTAEENWSGYYRRDASDVAARAGISAKDQTSLARYGKGSESAGNHSWTTATAPAGDTSIAKFNITLDPTKPADGTGDYRYEINQVGWVVEIDPYNPASTPRKRTAMGRMNHEGAWPGLFVAGVKPAWYTGDDARNEYLYKFVSDTAWAAGDANASDRLAMGDKYLDEGTLYVAKFNADGTGEWLPLVFGSNGLTATNATYPFADQGDVLINTRLAADVLGATKMDRPEWTATNPANGEIYLTLTNNSQRTVANTDAANPRAYVDPKNGGGESKGNANGHILRLRETGNTTEATTFAWDAYAYGAGVDLDPVNINLSGLDDTNDFSSPDGIWFGRASNASGLVNPLLWVQTDDGAYTDVSNCMMLCGQPGTVGDGGTKTITNTIEGATGTQTARVGAQPGAKLRRFLVGPKQCEVTGVDSTPDGRTLFVNIQHPGSGGNAAAPTSNWPQSQSGNATGRPRSATIVITKDDGGVVGL